MSLPRKISVYFGLFIIVFLAILTVGQRRSWQNIEIGQYFRETGSDLQSWGEALVGDEEQLKAEQEEARRVAEKIKHDQKIIEGRPKFMRTSFFLKAPYRGSVSLPEEWRGRYRAEEGDRFIDLLYASSSGRTAKLLSIRLLNEDERRSLGAEEGYLILEMLPDFVFLYKIFEAHNLPKAEALEYGKMRQALPDVIKSFKSEKQ